VAMPAYPFSRAATFSSRARIVGLPMRV